MVQAALFLEQAGRLEPEDLEILGHLADLSTRSGDPARAIQLLKKALGHNPESTVRAALEAQLKKLLPLTHKGHLWSPFFHLH